MYCALFKSHRYRTKNPRDHRQNMVPGICVFRRVVHPWYIENTRGRSLALANLPMLSHCLGTLSAQSARATMGSGTPTPWTLQHPDNSRCREILAAGVGLNHSRERQQAQNPGARTAREGVGPTLGPPSSPPAYSEISPRGDYRFCSSAIASARGTFQVPGLRDPWPAVQRLKHLGRVPPPHR